MPESRFIGFSTRPKTGGEVGARRHRDRRGDKQHFADSWAAMERARHDLTRSAHNRMVHRHAMGETVTIHAHASCENNSVAASEAKTMSRRHCSGATTATIRLAGPVSDLRSTPSRCRQSAAYRRAPPSAGPKARLPARRRSHGQLRVGEAISGIHQRLSQLHPFPLVGSPFGATPGSDEAPFPLRRLQSVRDPSRIPILQRKIFSS
jgi:hypothetical protein